MKLTDIYNSIKEEMGDEEILNSLKSQLAKVGIDVKHPGAFKVIDKRKDVKPNTITYMSLDSSGEIQPEDKVEEGLRDKIMTGVVCTILATGMVSCTKEDTAGFGYNVSSKSTEYTLGKGTPNKKVTISTPMGDEEHEVDSTLGDTKFYSGGQPLKFGRPMTPTEALIIKIGHAYQTEKNMNNKKGTPANKRWDYDPENSEVTGKGTYYQDNKTPFDNARQHPLWKLGLEAAQKAGKDVQALLQKADKEVQAQDWVKENKSKVNEGPIEINGKTVKTYTQNGDKSYNVTYDDGTTDRIAVSNDAWDEINILHMNATKVNEMDMNDPIMMKLRAKKDTKPTTPIKPTIKAPNQNQSKIDQLLQQRDDIIRDMEQEAEPEGGPIADEYADKLRMIDIALRKLKNQNMNEEFKRMQELAGI